MLKHESVFYFNQPFELELGGQLPGFQLKYVTLGKLNASRDNVVWVCHALTGNADVTTWWGDLFHADSPINTREHFIVCANMLGSCYGSTGPLSINSDNGKVYYHDFPVVTNRDVVRAFDLLRKALGIQSVHTLMGGSLGGQQALEWTITEPDLFEHVLLLATNAQHSPWGIAFNEAQRMAIAADPTWKNKEVTAGHEGLKAARAIGMLSYRSYETFAVTQAEKSTETTDTYRASTYQNYQGEKLARRFNAFSYWTLSKMMDSHNISRGRGGIEETLKQIKSKTLVVGIESDILFPINEQILLAENIPHADIEIIQSLYGHDGFLTEVKKLQHIFRKFYQSAAVSFL
jgi:homoserine O-acetyltransferase